MALEQTTETKMLKIINENYKDKSFTQEEISLTCNKPEIEIKNALDKLIEQKHVRIIRHPHQYIVTQSGCLFAELY